MTYDEGQDRPMMIKGPGLGEKNNELKAELQNMVELVIRVTNELHSSARFHSDPRHSGPRWRQCHNWVCQDALKRIQGLADYMLPNNPYALRQYRANLRRLQKAIRSAPPDLD
jgi:hypothetical protein